MFVYYSLLHVCADTHKRKLLPAWIREGLEKMEREKLKAEERQRQRKLFEERKLREEQEQAARDEEERLAVERGELSPSRLTKSRFVRQPSSLTPHKRCSPLECVANAK